MQHVDRGLRIQFRIVGVLSIVVHGIGSVGHVGDGTVNGRGVVWLGVGSGVPGRRLDGELMSRLDWGLAGELVTLETEAVACAPQNSNWAALDD
jgi:hypothetical protein